MPTMDDRIDNWLDSGRFRWPALVSLMALLALALVALFGVIFAAITTTLFDGHVFTSGQKLLVAYGWTVAFGFLLVAGWLRERRAERRAAAKATTSALPQETGVPGHVWHIWRHAATWVIWLLAVAVVAVGMTLSTLAPLEMAGVIAGYRALTNTQLLLIGGGWVCVWGAALTAFSRWDRSRAARRATDAPTHDASASTAQRTP